MKTRFGLFFATLFFCQLMAAQVHITVDNPESWSGEALRPYIGKTVVFDVPMIVCANANSKYVVSPWRRFQPESIGVVGSDDYRNTARINSTCMFNISGISGYHRCGEKIIGLTAVVNSTNSLTWVEGGKWSGNSRSEMESGLPDLGDYRLLVCGFNLENYYMTLGSMGASTAAERAIQQEKIGKALKHINADVFGFVELQQGDTAVEVLVNKLRKDLPGRRYGYFHDASAGTFQKVEYVFDSAKVMPIGTPAATDVEVSNRKKMVCFQEVATGEKFIFAINHFKAMNTGGEERRVNEAKAVLKLYNTYYQQTAIRDKDLLIMGDLNCYAFTSPIKVFTDNGLIDMHRAFHADSSYSYMFGGLASYIDHAIGNGTMYKQITGMSGYHINSDEDDYYTYDKSGDKSMFRCSDHDPVLVGLKLDSTIVYDPSPLINTAEILFGEAHKMIIQNAYDEESNSYYAIYNVNGWMIERKDITSPYFEVSLPEQAGIYIVYIYYDGQVHQRKLIIK